MFLLLCLNGPIDFYVDLKKKSVDFLLLLLHIVFHLSVAIVYAAKRTEDECVCVCEFVKERKRRVSEVDKKDIPKKE